LPYSLLPDLTTTLSAAQAIRSTSAHASRTRAVYGVEQDDSTRMSQSPRRYEAVERWEASNLVQGPDMSGLWHLGHWDRARYASFGTCVPRKWDQLSLQTCVQRMSREEDMKEHGRSAGVSKTWALSQTCGQTKSPEATKDRRSKIIRRE